ncbi:CueP family metal-binding protein [Cryobacterium sp. PAMC25264]|uniref:CueP family metal-binding protein n=1 Tax=Cryobacterium sp. PAMC25264 TaxID=2861288 RepID=UPI001C635CA4|nr:CueP family metal-binding protein [Cryobacterium sp. PAMC25264]QYF74445.1 CueP family metal-binding protein [Cryobacterium sp. PAMC25264]
MRLSKSAASLAALTLLLSLTACTATGGADDASVGTGASAGLGAEADALLASYDIQAPASATELIDQLQAQPLAERPDGLMASVRVDELLLSSGDGEVSLPLPEDEFRLSIAPYLTDTHECFYHSLTTCVGELGNTDLHVTITDDANAQVLVDSDITTFENGFFDVTLPTGLDITVIIDDGERSVELPLGTRAEDPTCVTTAQLS